MNIPEEIKQKIEEIILTDAQSWDDGQWIIPANSITEAAKKIMTEFGSGMKERVVTRYSADGKSVLEIHGLSESEPTKDEGKEINLSNVSRVELIEYPNKGRVYVNWNIAQTELSIQDDGKTLKVFVTAIKTNTTK